MNQNHGCKLLHPGCRTFMGSFDPESQSGPCFELLKTGALYKSESNKVGGSFCHNIITNSTRDGGFDWDPKMQKCLEEKSNYYKRS